MQRLRPLRLPIRPFLPLAVLSVLALGGGRLGLAQSGAAAPPQAEPAPPQAEPSESPRGLTRGGKPLAGMLASFDAESVVLEDGGRTQRVPWTELLWLQTGESKPVGAAPLRLDLVGGGRIAARIVGGDESGESFEIESPVLGRRRLAIDLVRSIRIQEDGRVQAPEELRPAGDALREMLYRRSGARLDPVPGYLERAEASGLRFQWSGAEEPRVYTWEEFGGLWLGVDPAAKPEADEPLLWVVLRDDSVVRGRPKSFAGTTWTLDGGELGELHLPAKDCLFVHVEHPATRLELSRLQPEQAEQRSFFGADAPVHWPYRLDRPVRDPSLPHNETLLVAGRVFPRGIGVHSFSQLRFVVPEGAVRFTTLVGIDDGALRLESPGVCDFRVRLNGELVREEKGVRAGVPAKLLAPLPVEPGQTLILEVDFGPAQHLGDRANWLAPTFSR